MICRNKSKLLPNSFPGVYQLDCTCNALYIGETKKKVITRTIEHQQDSFNGKWESSGATEHCLECHGQFNWINPKTLSTEQQYHRRKIRESLEIKKAKTNKRRKVLNRDERNLVKTNTWTPFFVTLNRKRNQHKYLTSNLETGFNSILYFNDVWKRLWLTRAKYYKIL